MLTGPQAAELSTHEMRIAVPSLLEKLKRYRPGLVCFVGKGIWDKFEDIVAKASTEPEKPWKPFELRLPEEAVAEDVKPVGIKLETDLSTTAIEREVDIPLEVDVKPNLMAKTTPQKRKAKPAFDWTQPRHFKLVHPAKDDRKESATLFWVVPSTSGLERTPVSRLTYDDTRTALSPAWCSTASRPVALLWLGSSHVTRHSRGHDRHGYVSPDQDGTGIRGSGEDQAQG